MKRIQQRYLVILAVGMLAAAPALADKPEWAGGQKAKHEQEDRRSGDEGHDRREHEEKREGRWHFSEQNREYLHEYYGKQFRRGHCPPGLAKKHNGCMPPGQARKWKVGEPLPHDVVFYDLPPKVIARIGPPPTGHRYVRVASDILLIAIGTSMVVDAIEDIGNQ